ncbi:MAG: hypothetical protein U9O87_05530, partial [Verrucomicrobiota bacterium]|nr:hypothetical protein [Verrucomicrobiota bacterium]
MLRINQIPICNSRYLLYRGDKISFSLKLSSKTPGKAFIRTNIGRRKITSEEIIKETEKKQYPAGRDWTDYQMKKISETEFSISLPLLEVGHFEAKTLFLPSDKTDPVWPEGENVTINVESANTRNNNSIYCSFVRQFGDNKSCNKSSEKLEKGLKKLDKKGYTIIPPS